MKLDQLPVELLMEIFSFLSVFDEVSLVNKLFYDIACRVNDPNIYLRIASRMNYKRLQSIQSSNRKISKMQIITYEQLKMHYISLVTRSSATIKSLSLSYYNVDAALEILALTPNVEQLNLVNLNPYQYHQASKQRCDPSIEGRCTDDFELKKLKALSFNGCYDEIFEVLVRIPAGIVTEMKITYFYWNTLGAALNRQLNIKKLKLESGRDYDVPSDASDVFDKLTLESLELDDGNMYSVMIAAMLSTQTKLKSLILSYRIGVVEQVMDAITGMSDLEKLAMDITEAPVESLGNIRKLKKLEDLKLRCDSNYNLTAKLKKLFNSVNTSLGRLNLELGITSVMSVDFKDTLTKSALQSLNLTHLKVFFLNPRRNIDVLKVDSILSNLNFIEVLETPIYEELLIYQQLSNYFNPTLKELKIEIDGAIYQPWLTKLITAYPNLKKLHLAIVWPMTAEITLLDAGLILNGFEKLESLTLRTGPTIPTVVSRLQNYKANLKFLSLELLPHMINDELIKTVRARFDVINFDRLRYLNMAVDRWTMIREVRNLEFCTSNFNSIKKS